MIHAPLANPDQITRPNSDDNGQRRDRRARRIQGAGGKRKTAAEGNRLWAAGADADSPEKRSGRCGNGGLRACQKHTDSDRSGVASLADRQLVGGADRACRRELGNGWHMSPSRFIGAY